MVAKKPVVVAKAAKAKAAAGSAKKKKRSKIPLESMDMEEFMRADGSDSGADDVEEPPRTKQKDQDEGDRSISASEHKQALARLMKQDPEFYKFLEQEDKELLQFDVSDDDDQVESRGDADSADGSDDQEQAEVSSSDKAAAAAADDDDGNAGVDDDDSGVVSSKSKRNVRRGSRLVTPAMVRRWASGLKESNPGALLQTVIAAFKAAVEQNGSEDDDKDAVAAAAAPSQPAYVVEGSAVFNAIVRLCLTQLLPALAASLRLPAASEEGGDKPLQPSNSKRWSRLKVHIKSYLQDVVKLVAALPKSHSLNPVLKHVSQLVPYYACFPKLSKLLVKRLTDVWSTGEETPRVLAFFSIIKLVRLQQPALLEPTVKIMYLAYVRNTKFTAPSTLALIAFMQRSLVELLALDHDLAYQHAFVYIRQLAIHLRNAVVTKKKEVHQTVYSWQFVHSLGLWARLVSTVHPSDALQQLIYPLVQLIIGTARLIPTAKFYPLRFHCVRLLNMVSTKTRTYIPVLPLLLEVLQATDFNKKFSRTSVKPFDFSCMLKLSKAQLQDRAFKDGTVEQLYELTLDHMNVHAHSVGFPELILPAVIQMRAFTKKCKVATYCKQIKLLIEKAEETCRVINQRRSVASFSLADTTAVDVWEAHSKDEGTPISKYWLQWQKVRARETATQRADAASSGGDGAKSAGKRNNESRQEPASKKQKPSAGDSDSESDYSDLNSDELEELAKSAEEDSEDEDETMEQDSAVTEEAVSTSRKGSSRKAQQLPRAAAAASDDDNGDDTGDVVEDFAWSDSDGESSV